MIGPGQTAIVWLDVAIDGGAQVPTDLTHSVHLKVAKPLPGLVGADVTQDVAPVTVSTRKPVSISPPLDGPNWLDANGCCDMSAHRMAANPINGKIFVSERFAIDYVQLTDDFRLFTGDPTKPEPSYPYFGAPIHAVGDGKVVSVVDNLPEQTPGKTPSGLPAGPVRRQSHRAGPRRRQLRVLRTPEAGQHHRQGGRRAEVGPIHCRTGQLG